MAGLFSVDFSRSGSRSALGARKPDDEKGTAGEFETLVTDGPHMDRRIELESETEWDGTRGTLQVTDAWLE
ncbi:hypothetical protein [Haloarcula pellucida]|uniref:Diphthamide synthase domain-containing protein n=1 Tax=Haloarcula pellucida TaxID=1427151 RepID=A0A830GFL7_9EURY|nr:hypothetical protein GCM10009030_03070 [Halomicroarcula pellucida]